jgi:hypothetical protein
MLFEICGSFIKMHAETKIVEFGHFSVYEYLTTRQLPNGTDLNPYFVGSAAANLLLMTSCFTYLASPLFAAEPPEPSFIPSHNGMS